MVIKQTTHIEAIFANPDFKNKFLVHYEIYVSLFINDNFPLSNTLKSVPIFNQVEKDIFLLQYHTESNLYRQKGKLPNDLKKTLPPALAAHALNAFKDEYILDFININPEDDERVL